MGKKPPQSHGCHSLMGEMQLLFSGDLEMIIMSEVSKTERDRYHMILLICRIKKKKKDTNEPIYKTEIDSDIENKFTVTKGEVGRGVN